MVEIIGNGPCYRHDRDAGEGPDERVSQRPRQIERQEMAEDLHSEGHTGQQEHDGPLERRGPFSRIVIVAVGVEVEDDLGVPGSILEFFGGGPQQRLFLRYRHRVDSDRVRRVRVSREGRLWGRGGIRSRGGDTREAGK